MKRFSYAIHGIYIALRHDHSVQLHILIGAVCIPLLFFILHPLQQWEFLILLLGWFLILITEIQNSSLEEALDKLHPERHDNIKKSKDMAAGAVLLSGIYFAIAIYVLIASRVF